MTIEGSNVDEVGTHQVDLTEREGLDPRTECLETYEEGVLTRPWVSSKGSGVGEGEKKGLRGVGDGNTNDLRLKRVSE